MKTVCILDRNIVSDIRRYLSSEPSPSINLARSFDKPSYVISTLLSTVEGKHTRTQTLSEFHEAVQDEAKLISIFYKHAQVDSKYLLSNTLNTYDALVRNIDNKTKQYTPLITMVKEKFNLKNTPSLKNARIIEDKIVDFAHSNKISLRGVTGICLLSTVYGNSDSRKVLKPEICETSEEKNRAAYNTIYDLEVVKLLLNINLTKTHPDIKFKFITRDAGLRAFLRTISGSRLSKLSHNMSGDQSAEYTIDITKELYPSLKKDEDRLAFRERFQSYF